VSSNLTVPTNFPNELGTSNGNERGDHRGRPFCLASASGQVPVRAAVDGRAPPPLTTRPPPPASAAGLVFLLVDELAHPVHRFVSGCADGTLARSSVVLRPGDRHVAVVLDPDPPTAVAGGAHGRCYPSGCWVAAEGP
jgi:hypothetical protein